MSRFASDITSALEQLVSRVMPGAKLLSARPFGHDAAESASSDSAGSEVTAKGTGYGEPLELRVVDDRGEEQKLVFHTARPDIFGHERRSDRAAEMLLGYDTFGQVKRHVPALDVGAIHKSGESLVSLDGTGEFYLLTRFAPGRLYAEDLRRIAQDGASDKDIKRAEQLASYLAELHSEKLDHPPTYVRSVRDLVGSGEGIFGIVDGYPLGREGFKMAQLERIEELCLRWRWRLNGRTERLSRAHGDFHPFNLLFDDAGSLHVLDASRGSAGDPADDTTCLAINYPFFALQAPGSWARTFRELYYRFWDRYTSDSGDNDVLAVAPPYLAWRGLVLANPRWYPEVPPEARQRILTWMEAVLRSERFRPSSVEELFA